MNSKLLKKIIVIAIALIAIYMPKCFAAGASISASTTSAKPGDTIEMYIDLTTPSIGYDLQINADNAGLISVAQVINKIGSGDASRIYLVQLASSSDRITHPSGTRIATIKYTISETATTGSKITLNVAGNVAGESSSDKNTMNESITINIVEPQSTDEEPKEELPKTEDGNEGTEGELPKVEEPKEEGEVTKESGKEEGTGQENQPKEEEELEQPNATKKEEKDETTAKVILPAAGLKGVAIIAIVVLIIVVANSFRKYYNNRDIK